MTPIGPAPVMRTSSPASSNDSALCTALPSGSRHADADRVAAQMTPPGPAVAAMPAGHMTLDGNALPGREAAHLAADLRDRALELMTDDERHRDRLLRPGIPVPDVKIGAADRRVMDPHQEIVRTDRRTRDVLEPDPRLAPALDERAHQRRDTR